MSKSNKPGRVELSLYPGKLGNHEQGTKITGDFPSVSIINLTLSGQSGALNNATTALTGWKAKAEVDARGKLGHAKNSMVVKTVPDSYLDFIASCFLWRGR
ncbi:hypothetical protein RRG08_065394 [Elysia crispata]|uniref:Uncharacterized protein n=1 Tax=Elysia crispata TaxID=231223 RepID=A0AAE1DZK5_9GAST|nr:hypothetical protein RRG08_065394 [Elysia crispata]